MLNWDLHLFLIGLLSGIFIKSVMKNKKYWFWFEVSLLSIVYGWLVYRAASIAVWWFCTVMWVMIVIIFLRGYEWGKKK